MKSKEATTSLFLPYPTKPQVDKETETPYRADSDFKSTTYLGRLTASPLLALRATPYDAISKVEGLSAAIHSYLCVMLDHGSRMLLI